jgi:hypothetical protein
MKCFNLKKKGLLLLHAQYINYFIVPVTRLTMSVGVLQPAAEELTMSVGVLQPAAEELTMSVGVLQPAAEELTMSVGVLQPAAEKLTMSVGIPCVEILKSLNF